MEGEEREEKGLFEERWEDLREFDRHTSSKVKLYSAPNILQHLT